jgi:hypothetical protein
VAELPRKISLLSGENVDIAQVCVAERAQFVGDTAGVSNFRPNEPERIDKRKIDELFPRFTQVPE